ncbi:MAG: glutamate racemase [Lachnospiraceae bacterium]|nr:glutamate racemase [Lachnospiraceae bacterium]
MSNRPIGVFDSGVGGLTVLKELIRRLPNERYVYFGDMARAPYGPKSKDTVTRFSKQIVRFLQEQGVKAIIVACNTASAMALNTLEREWDLPIIGVVKPGVKAAAETTKTGHIGLIGTEATITSGIYEKYLKEYRNDIKLTGRPCPLFVSLVEEGCIEDPVTTEIARRYMSGFKDTDMDTLIMGCTHFPMIEDTIQRAVGNGVRLVNPAYETARSAQEMLERNGLLNTKDITVDEEAYKFFVSDAPQRFKRIANLFLPLSIGEAKQVAIEKY